MKQKLIATTIGMALVIAPLPAFTADSSAPNSNQASGPLAPGKAAGVQQAQGTVTIDGVDYVWVAGVLVAVGLGAWALTQNSDKGGGGGTTPTPSPTTTTTTTTTAP